ncbi:Hypothetical predicted protein [Paramuricea clavata]|uniref:Uncharacterized protein n=1 Tax=Paramuricea clavata TaxID=317549 RepID=A0A6S7JTX2_PARCT|nr:Hypothetical predicted protein [Paramuricea clavata]
MGFTNRVGITYYVSLTAVLCLWLCRSNGAESGFKIFRGEQDIFMNMQCYPGSERCNYHQCKSYGAECVDAKCKFCRCVKGRSTFIINQDGGVCKSDEEIVPESVPNVAFWLKNNEYDKCLKLESSSSNYIIGTNCTAWPTVDMLWIQINANNKRLMNVKTLKCMKRSTNNKKVTINQCEKANTNWQRIRCTDNRDGMEIRWNVGSKRRYLRLPNSAADGDANAISSSSNGNQRWRSKQGTTCIKSTAYKGCYRFSDGSFMKYLNYNETKSKLRISAPIFKENDGSCYVSNKFKLIQNGQEWKDGRNSLFDIKDDTKELKAQRTLHCNDINVLEFFERRLDDHIHVIKAVIDQCQQMTEMRVNEELIYAPRLPFGTGICVPCRTN